MPSEACAKSPKGRLLDQEINMRKVLMLFITLLMATSYPTRVKAAPFQSELPQVHAVLFYSNGCPYCDQVLTTTLPALQDQYKSQLSILLIEIVTLKDVGNLYTLGASLGLSKEQVAVPFLLIGRTPLVGGDEIESKFSGLIDKYLTSGGMEYPDMPLLNEMLSRGISFSSFDPYLHLIPPSAAGTNTTGMAMAWGIMVFMLIALILAILLILRAFQGKPLREIKGWLDTAIPILSLIGLGAAIYLTYVEITHTQALCGPVGDCNAVQSSPYAKIFGVLPIGLVGAIGYITILVAWLWRRYRTDSFSNIAGPAMYGMALFGTLFSIYLHSLELFVIH